MAVTVNNYSTLHVISPYYLNVERSAASSDIIIITDVVNNNEPGEMHNETKGGDIWLEVLANGSLSILTAKPNYGDALKSPVQYLDKMRVRVKNGELFLVEYNNAAKIDATQRTAVTGFQMGSGDKVYVLINTTNNEITVFEPK